MRRSQIPHDVFFSQPATPTPARSPEIPAVSGDGAEEQVAERGPDIQPEAKTPKLQICVYVDPETAKVLDETRLTLQYEHGHKASKSALVDYAIRRLSGDMSGLIAAAEAGELDRG